MLQSPTQVTGVKMKLIAWAIALAAAGLTPAAAQAPQAAQPIKEVTGPPPQPLRPSGRRARASTRRMRVRLRRPPRTRRRPKPTATDFGSCASPPEHIGVPIRAGTGIQEQVTGDRPRSRRLPQQLAADPLRPDFSVFVLGAARLRDDQIPPRRQPDPVAHLAQHLARGGLDPGPGADPGRDRHSVDRACCASNTRRRPPT